MKFYGPYVQCGVADDTVSAMIKNTINQSVVAVDGVIEIYNAYFAYVPDLSTPEQLGILNTRTSNSSRSSNQLWLSFKQNGTGWDEVSFPECPITEYSVCKLHNASYDLTVAFQDGAMKVSNYIPTVHEEVPYPSFLVNTSDPSEIVKMSYSAYMWAFTDLVVGSMGLFNETVTYPNGTIDTTSFGNIETNLKNTALLGSSDLDCFFAIDWMFNNVTWDSASPQRQLDIDFAQNLTLHDLIAELSANLTISLMSDVLLG